MLTRRRKNHLRRGLLQRLFGLTVASLFWSRARRISLKWEAHAQRFSKKRIALCLEGDLHTEQGFRSTRNQKTTWFSTPQMFVDVVELRETAHVSH